MEAGSAIVFFCGWRGGASAVIANMANWLSDDRELVRNARWMAAAGGALSSALLIKDLGMPSRFLNCSASSSRRAP